MGTEDQGSRKFRLASCAQREEIARHRKEMARRQGRQVSLDDAARDWITYHAAEWRERFEAHWHEPSAT